MLTPPEPDEHAVGFGAAEAAVRDRRIELHCRVSHPDVPDGVVEFGWVSGSAQTQGFIGGDAPGFNHVVEPGQETVALRPLHPDPIVAFHGVQPALMQR